MPGRLMRVFGGGELLTDLPFTFPLVNVIEPDLEPVPSHSAFAITVTLSPEMMPVSRFTFDTVACPVALASNEVICPEALVLTVPKLPMRGDWNPLALFCAEPPVQPIVTGEIGPIDVEPGPARPLA